MKVGSSPSIGRENHKEESCGRCHDGKNAFDVSFQACGRCHLPQAK
ncbi:MAG: cytochrome c3 family protein [Nitrospinota bacterium]